MNLYPAFLNRIICLQIVGAAALTGTMPLHAEPRIEKGFTLGDIAFGIRMEKLIKKAKKYFKEENSDKLIEAMFNIHREVEAYSGKKISLDKQLDMVEKEAKANGIRIEQAHIQELKKRFKKHEKRSNHKAMHLAACIEYDLPYSEEEEQILYQNMSKNAQDNEEEAVIPTGVTLGISMTLCGQILQSAGNPVCKAAAPFIKSAGLTLLAKESK